MHAFYFTTKNCVIGKKAVTCKNGNEDLSSVLWFSVDTWFDIISNAVKCIACNN